VFVSRQRPKPCAPRGMQVSFALGAVKSGIPGGLLGGVLFQLPGLVMMSALGVGAASYLQDSHPLAKATTDGMCSHLTPLHPLYFPASV
jgi:chromate transport protein ChrA